MSEETKKKSNDMAVNSTGLLADEWVQIGDDLFGFRYSNRAGISISVDHDEDKEPIDQGVYVTNSEISDLTEWLIQLS